MRRTTPFLSLLLAATAASAQERTLFRSPTASQTHIVFSHADDLWIVPRAGGDAVRLTSGQGAEQRPLFSPDGTMVAFTGEYDGNVDVFVVAAGGGVPKRLTFHPAEEEAASWTPDGKRILFNHNGSAVDAKPRMFTVDLDGGFPQPVPLPIGLDGSFSPDGKQLAYLPHERADSAWKRYRGGRAAAIWIANLADSSVSKLPRVDWNDHSPMWIGNRIFYLSDRSGPYTLYSYDLTTKKAAAAVEAKGLDIKSASAGPGLVVYEQFGEIHLYDLKSGKTQKVSIRLNGDIATVRPRMEKLAKYISWAGISPSGARAVFEARGEVFTVPADKGDIRNLTNSTGVADRMPSWSPDGKWIAHFSDESGEYQLHLRDQTGRGEVRKIALEEKPTFYYSPSWSPDSKKISYYDKASRLWYVDIEKKQPVKIAESLYDARGELRPSWSPDSQWIAYQKRLKSMLNAVAVYSLDSGQSTQVTDGMSDARYSTWDRNGKFLYFAASNDVAQTLMGLDMGSTNRPITRSLYVVVLQKSETSPLAPESDEEKLEAGKDPKKEEKKDEKVTVKIDFEGISQRILPLPVPPRNYSELTAGKTGIFFYLESPVVDAAHPGPQSITLHKFDLSKRKAEPFVTGVTSFDVSANGEKILLLHPENKWQIAPTGASPKAGEGMLKTETMEALIDPRAEWKQMYKETWRIERDFFYDPGYHGLDIQAAAERYERYLPALGSRRDLNYLFEEMLGELSVGHLFVRGGDLFSETRKVQNGLLGADYTIENGRYRFARVYEGDNWSPDTRAPLTQPGVNVRAGEFLLAIDGRELRDSDNVYAFFEGKAGKAVALTIGNDAAGSVRREVTVIPADSEVGLRTLAWREDNRKKVDQLSNGSLAYMHLPDTGGGGYTQFNRFYFAQADKAGVVIDERYNHGGQAADYIIDHLRRPVWSYWTARDGEAYHTPGLVITGPKAMVVNEYSGSGGDLLPWLFKRAKLGPVVGKRTWGGLVGIGGYPALMDGGGVTAPHFAFYTPEGKWEVENRGTEVDVEVDLDPKAWREGRDTQLEKAVELAMAELKRSPPAVPKRPAFPNYHPKQTAR